MRRPSFLLAGLALTFVAGSFAACGSDEIRKSGKGESCARTDDCAEPLVCVALACSDGSAAGGTGGSATTTGGTAGTGATGGATGGSGGTTTGGSGGTGGTGSGAAGGSSGGSGGSGGNGLDSALCAACLDDECGPQITACDADCLALEACIETLCTHLSSIASPDEGPCQVHCQQEHVGSKTKHLAVVNCAFSSSCPPCSSYPWDHDACVVTASAGACAAPYAACNASIDCKEYRDCVSACSTLAECLACDNSASGQAGAPLLLDYQQCIAAECLAESWLK